MTYLPDVIETHPYNKEVEATIIADNYPQVVQNLRVEITGAELYQNVIATLIDGAGQLGIRIDVKL